MSGSRWKRGEIRSLYKQVREGKTPDQITIEGRSKFGVRYKFFRLGFYFSHWSAREIRFLRKSINEGKKPWEVIVEGRSRLAVRNKSIRSGIWKPKQRVLKPWTLGEIRKLKRLVEGRGYTAKRLSSNGYFPSRSVNSISQQMRRNKIRRRSR